MNPLIKSFLEKERVSALSIMTGNKTCHSAAMHFSFKEDPFEIYFSIDKTSRKAQLINKEPTSASFVIGFSEEEWKTFQVDGIVKIVTDAEELSKIKEGHYKRNPSSQQFESDPNTVFLVFSPTWWRYTDFMEEPILIIEGKR
ncbi:MAG: hypothetical protein Fur003_0250 [Candidatus Dojkabacteria bacterium]